MTEYEAWFKKQDEDFQKIVLGAKKLEAYKAGNYKVKSLDDVRGRELSLEHIKKFLVK